jgi:urea transport system substrate-binding protein
MKKLKYLCLAAGLLAAGFTLPQSITAQTQGPIKIGVLHSLSGTMAISETTLKDTVLMLIEEQNRKGGLLGRKLQAVVVDPASDWPLFAEKARELLEKDKASPHPTNSPAASIILRRRWSG